MHVIHFSQMTAYLPNVIDTGYTYDVAIFPTRALHLKACNQLVMARLLENTSCIAMRRLLQAFLRPRSRRLHAWPD